MTDQSAQQGQTPNPPQARIHKRGFSWIWLVPVVALGIVGWLGYQHLQQQGPTITITFERGEGLEAGKTQIKHKSVPIGIVKSVELSDDMKEVIVTADMDRNVEGHLGKDTKFWVVRPRFNAGNISGLDTLVSGSYIAMRPVEGDETYHFKGLDNPPVDVQDQAGERFTLHTEHLSTLDQGSSVYYRGIEVGTVLGYRLLEDGKTIDIYIFVREPFAKFVTGETRFWNASAFDINTSVNGFEVKTESFRALLAGGVTFDTPTDPMGEPAKGDTEFQLYDSERMSDAEPRGPHYYYFMRFADQVHALGVHAPVELMGIPVGHVVAVNQQVNAETGTVETPVTIEIEEAAMNLAQPDPKHKLKGEAAVSHALDMLIRKGYRAKLVSGSLLTGQRYVQITPAPDAPPAKLIMGGQSPEIPTASSGSLDDLTAAGTKVMGHADTVVQHADRLVLNLAQLTGPGKNELPDTVKSLNGTVRDMDRVLNNLDADVRPLGSQLPQLLKELKNTARSATDLLDYVDQHPESLLLGRKSESSDTPADANNQPQPEQTP